MTDKLWGSCPVCNNHHASIMIVIARHGNYEHLLCRVCGCIFISPPPSSLPNYDTTYNMHFFRPGDIRKAGIMAAKLGEILKTKYESPTFLEVGAGNGLTVLLLKLQSIRAWGLEIDEHWASWLHDHLHIQMLTGRFEDLETPMRFDFIYSSHVIEHCLDPHAFIARAAGLLKPGGRLYIDTPNAERAILKKDLWHHFDTRHPVEHVCVLSMPSTALLAKKSGLLVEGLTRQDEFDSFAAILLKPEA